MAEQDTSKQTPPVDEPRVVQEVGDTATGVALVAGGLGSCIVPESVTRLRVAGVRYQILDDKPALTVDLSVMFRAEDRSPLLHTFLDTVAAFSDDK